MKEKTIMIDSTYQLEAVHAQPDNTTSRVFIIVSGSGPGDMDGNFKSLKVNLYKQLSDYLVSQDFATIRYNKRGIGKSEGTFNETGLFDFLEDLDAVVSYAKDHYNKVYILGHSEGAMLATFYSEKHHVDGMILLSGAGTDLQSALNYQQQCVLDEIATLKGIKGLLLRLLVKEKSLWKKQQKFYDKIKSSKKDVVRIALMPIQAKWMREHFTYQKEDMLELLSNVSIPTFAITGTKDVQANVEDLDAVEALNNPNITIHRVENMSHMLRTHLGPKSMLNLKKQYKGDSKKPLSDELYETLTQCIKKLS